MKLTFHGAAHTVTGSQHLVEVNGKRILLDCGLYQGRRAEANARNRVLPFDVQALDVVILSHAHIDHSGNIPNLVNSGYRGEIYCTHATRDLCSSMLLDSGHIQERDAEYVNKRNQRKGEPPVAPLYTQDDAAASLNAFTSIAYNRAKQILPGISLTLMDAGHMLGSAFVVLDIEDEADGKLKRLVFSGDIGRAGIPIIRDPQTINSADYLIMESTYGDRLHPPYEDDSKRMESIIVETHQRGGSVLIPAFAVGRTQQLIVMLHELMHKGDIPQMPVFIDSPLAIDVTAAFRTHPECYDADINQFIRAAEIEDPFGFDMLQYTRTTEESKRLNYLREPAIIIAASGMVEHGRILHHLVHRIEDPRTTILIVGWQAEHTLGRRLVDLEPEVRIFGDTFQRNAQVEVLNGFSGHADRDELLAWVGAMTRKPERTFLVHGEPQAATALVAALREQYDLRADVPALHESFEVE